jgi:formylglycine-generating enzyme required for sulfatase activity/serine/threonine protein kinase
MIEDDFSLSGQVLNGRIVVERVAGKGGCSVVYRGFDRGLGCPVAIKCLQTSLPTKQRVAFLETLKQEATLLVQLNKRTLGAVHVHSADSVTSPSGDWVPYIELEWLDGLPLDEILDPCRGKVAPRAGSTKATLPWSPVGGRLPLHVVIALLDRAAGALATAHAINIAHRDVKPSNIFVELCDGVPQSKVIDFGIAKLVDSGLTPTGAPTATGKGIQALTPEYAAPEQWDRKYGTTGPWTDVFSFALLCVELLTGQRALEGENMGEIIASCTSKLRPTPAAKNVLDLPAEVEATFQRALAVDPTARPSDMGKFWRGMKAAAGYQEASPDTERELVRLFGPLLEADEINPTVLKPAPGQPQPPTTQPGGAVPGGLPTMDQTTPSLSRTAPTTVPRGRPVSLVAGGLALIAGTAGVMYFVLRQHQDQDSTPIDGGPPIFTTTTPSGLASVPVVPPPPPGPLTPCPKGMVYIPGGAFDMGSDQKLTKKECGLGKENAESRPFKKHRVTVTPYCIDKLEVSVADYKTCITAGKCTPPGHSKDEPLEANNPFEFNKLDHPIDLVDFAQAKGYCSYRRARLPTEEEWEFAARGTDGRKYPWGDWPKGRRLTCQDVHQADRTYAAAFGEGSDCFNKEAHGPWPVGHAKDGASPFGVLDMAGNVMEWVDEEDGTVRGGGWSHGGATGNVTPACKLLTYWREPQPKDAKDPEVGFRCATEPLPGSTPPPVATAPEAPQPASK